MENSEICKQHIRDKVMQQSEYIIFEPANIKCVS